MAHWMGSGVGSVGRSTAGDARAVGASGVERDVQRALIGTLFVALALLSREAAGQGGSRQVEGEVVDAFAALIGAVADNLGDDARRNGGAIDEGAAAGPDDRAAPRDDNPIRSAFFGLDDGVGPLDPRDGLVVSFAEPIDGASLNASDFEVIDAAGNRQAPQVATLRPADEPGENRSVLLIGRFGDAETNPITQVSVVGDLRTEGANARNLRGASTTDITPLDAGPEPFFAETLAPARSEFPGAGGQVVQVAWQGGITPVDPNSPEAELFRFYTVYTDNGDGTLTARAPSAIGDIDDQDNHHQLLVDTTDPIVKVGIEAGVVQDPNGDPNPATEIALTPARS